MPTIRGQARRRASERTHLHCPPRRDQSLCQDTDAIRASNTLDSVVGQRRGGSASARMPATRVPLCPWPEACVLRAPIDQGEETRRDGQVVAIALCRFLTEATDGEFPFSSNQIAARASQRA